MAKQNTPRSGSKSSGNSSSGNTGTGNQQPPNQSSESPRRPNRNNLWALLIVAGVVLIYVINGAFMPVVDPEEQRALATATAIAENGIPAQIAATQTAEAEGVSAVAPAEEATATPVAVPEEVTAEEVAAEEVATEEEAPEEEATGEAQEESSEEPTEEPTEAPTETPTQAPTSTPTAAPTSTPRPTDTPTPEPTRVPARINGVPTILYDDLPPQAHDTIALIDEGGPFPFDRDGITFQNREGLLPQESRNYYREYTVITPGIDHRGARRIVEGADGELYYTDDHYESFSYVVR